MENLILTFLFIVALSGTIYFFGGLIQWSVYKIIDKEKEIRRSDINNYCLSMIISIICWSIIFYVLISR